MKKLLLLFAMVAALALPSRALVIDDPKVCDVNGDGGVNMGDLSLIMNCISSGDNYADVNGDGIVNYIDYAWVYYVIVEGDAEKATEDQCDFNGDGVVNGADFDIIYNAVSNWAAYDARFDLNHDGRQDYADLGMIAILLADLEAVEVPGISIYVKADEPPMFYTWIDNGDQPVGGWPGMLLTETATVNRIDYYVYTFDPKYSSVNVILNNGDWGSGNQTGDFLGITKDAFFIYDGAGFAYGLIPPQVYGNPTGEYVFYVNTDRWSQVYAEIDGVPYPMTKVGVDGAGFEVYKWEGEMDYTPSRITFNNGNGLGVMDNMGNIYDDAYVKGGYYVYTFYAAKETAYLDMETTIVYEGEDQVPVLEDCAIRLLDSEATWNAYDDVRFEITGTYFNQSARKGDVYYSVDGGQYVKFAENLNSEDTFAEEVTMSFNSIETHHTITLISRDESNASSEVVTVLEATDVKALRCANLQDYTYTGDAITFDPEIYYENKLLSADEDYYAFFLNNVEVGQATLRIEGVPMQYIGARDFNFTINPMPVTEMPVINYDEETFTVTVEGEGEIHAYVDGEEVELPYTFEQGETDVTYVVTATAQEEGKLISETAERVITVPAKVVAPEVTATPVINYDAETFTVTVEGAGEIHAYVDGVEVQLPYTFEQGEEDVTYVVTATAQEEGKLISETAERVITVPAKPAPEVTEAPEIVVTETDEAVIIDAVGEGEIHVYVNGEEVEIPCTIAKGETEQTIVVTATAQEEGKLISETATKTIVVPAKVEEPVDDPHMVGYWIVMTDLAGEEHWYSMNADPNGDPNWSIMMTLHHQPWDINVPFYFMVNGTRYGAETDMQLPEMGDSEHTIQNPVFAGENNWYVPAGYTYNWGLQFKNGEVWLLVAQGPMTGIEELVAGKEVAGVRYFNMAGQEMQEAAGICIAVTTYTDGTTSAMKVIK